LVDRTGISEKVDDMARVFELLTTHGTDVDVDMDSSNQLLFDLGKLAERAKMEGNISEMHLVLV
jgi:hypothetical protein